jgi:hypothetical protein
VKTGETSGLRGRSAEVSSNKSARCRWMPSSSSRMRAAPSAPVSAMFRPRRPTPAQDCRPAPISPTRPGIRVQSNSARFFSASPAARLRRSTPPPPHPSSSPALAPFPASTSHSLRNQSSRTVSNSDPGRARMVAAPSRSPLRKRLQQRAAAGIFRGTSGSPSPAFREKGVKISLPILKETAMVCGRFYSQS